MFETYFIESIVIVESSASPGLSPTLSDPLPYSSQSSLCSPFASDGE